MNMSTPPPPFFPFFTPTHAQEFERQLLLKSSDDKNVLMHAASSGDAMVLKTVADACRTAIPPHKVLQ